MPVSKSGPARTFSERGSGCFSDGVRARPGTASAAEGGALQYNRDIRPILAENCFACHGPDSAARKADLRLDKREAAVKAGAIAPGDTEASELIARINATDPKEVMPPAATTKTLEPEAKRYLASSGLPPALLTSCTGRSFPRSGPKYPRSRIDRGSEIRSMNSCWPSSRKTA